MKNVLLQGALLFFWIGSIALSYSQTTAFTYQGRLDSGGSPASGSYDLRFAIFDQLESGLKLSPFSTNSAVTMTNGLFTVILDYGSEIFPGADRWLDIAVRTNGSDTFSTLTPRQALMPTPYAMHAATASSVPAANITGTLDMSQLPTVILTNNGSGLLQVDRFNAGTDNLLAGNTSTILGGYLNTNTADHSAIAAGIQNTIAAGASYSFIGGGQHNTILPVGHHSAIVGGENNTVSGQYSYACGVNAKSLHDYSFVWNDSAGNDLLSTTNNQVTIRGTYGIRLLSGNPSNITVNGQSVLAGSIPASKINGGLLQVDGINAGTDNLLAGNTSTILGGYLNTNTADHSAIAAGIQNTIAAGASYSFIGGGQHNTILPVGHHSAIVGGENNTVSGQYSYACGVNAKSLHDYSFVWNDSAGNDLLSTTNNQVTIRGTYGIRLLSGNPSNITVNGQSVLAGSIPASKINGGLLQVDGINAGMGNSLAKTNSANLGGLNNTNAAYYSSITEGSMNYIASGADYASIGGGQFNTIWGTGHHSTIPNGSGNVVAGEHSFAGGLNAQALHNNTFVWNTTAGGLASTTNRQFLVNADGGIQFFSGYKGMKLDGQPVLAGMLDASQIFGGLLRVSYLDVGTGHSLTNGWMNGIASGENNVNAADYAFIGGGLLNAILAGSTHSFIGGGAHNTISNTAMYSTIPGGYGNVVGGSYSFAGGASARALHDFSFVWNDWDNVDGLETTTNHQFLVSAFNGIQFHTSLLLPKPMTVNGYEVLIGPTLDASKISGGILAVDQLKVGANHTLGANAATIAGGLGNTAAGNYAAIGGGAGNGIASNTYHCAISGGSGNTISSLNDGSSIGGGYYNVISNSSDSSFIGSGWRNLIHTNSSYGFIGGGHSNTIQANSWHATIGNGLENTILANGLYGVIPGGRNNEAGSYAFAAGCKAKARHDGAFVWADSDYWGPEFASTTNDQFLVRAHGGVGINTNNPNGQTLAVAGDTHIIGNLTVGFASGNSMTVARDTQITGLLRIGSESGTAEVPSPAGLVIRRLNSTLSTSNSVVAKALALGSSTNIALIRDGSNAGFQIRYPATLSGRITIACMGIDNTGTQRNFYTTLATPAAPGVIQIYSNSQNIVHFECTFGDTYNPGQHLTQVTLTRFDSDNFWSGNLTSTYNQ